MQNRPGKKFPGFFLCCAFVATCVKATQLEVFLNELELPNEPNDFIEENDMAEITEKYKAVIDAVEKADITDMQPANSNMARIRKMLKNNMEFFAF